MTTDKPKELWISKGNSKFCSDLVYDYESDSYVKCSPDGFYDVVSEKDTIEGGMHVIEYSAYQDLKEELTRLQQELGKEVESHRETAKVLNFYADENTWIEKVFDQDGSLIEWYHKIPNDRSIFSYSIGDSKGNFNCLGRRARARIEELKNESK